MNTRTAAEQTRIAALIFIDIGYGLLGKEFTSSGSCNHYIPFDDDFWRYASAN
jgi:hypothetical protein